MFAPTTDMQQFHYNSVLLRNQQRDYALQAVTENTWRYFTIYIVRGILLYTGIAETILFEYTQDWNSDKWLHKSIFSPLKEQGKYVLELQSVEYNHIFVRYLMT